MNIKKCSINIVIFLVSSLALLLLGQPLWCSCNALNIWTSNYNSSHTSQHLFDPYSFSHFQHGLFFFILISFFLKDRRNILSIGLFIELCWEILENTPFIINKYREQTVSLGYSGDSIANSFGDMMSCFFGLYIASKIPIRWVLVVYVAIEISMLLAIKDSLTLNIIMLVHPLSFIKEWQEKLA